MLARHLIALGFHAARIQSLVGPAPSPSGSPRGEPPSSSPPTLVRAAREQRARLGRRRPTSA